MTESITQVLGSGPLEGCPEADCDPVSADVCRKLASESCCPGVWPRGDREGWRDCGGWRWRGEDSILICVLSLLPSRQETCQPGEWQFRGWRLAPSRAGPGSPLSYRWASQSYRQVFHEQGADLKEHIAKEIRNLQDLTPPGPKDRRDLPDWRRRPGVDGGQVTLTPRAAPPAVLDNFKTLDPILGVVRLQTLTLTWSQAVPRVL